MEETTIAMVVVLAFFLILCTGWSAAYIAFKTQPQIVCKTVELGLKEKHTECHMENSKAKWFKGLPTKEDKK